MRKILIIIGLLGAMSHAQIDDIFYGEYGFPEEPLKILNLLPPIRNQNFPRLCHVSWAFALTTAMSVQFNILKKGVHPEVVLSPQNVVHKRPENSGYTCEDASKFNIETMFEHLKTQGVSDEGCNNWYADDKVRTDNLAECMDCHNGEDMHKDPVCEFVPYHAHYIKSWRKIESQKTIPKEKYRDLKEQILKSLVGVGPLVCKINFSSKFYETRANHFFIYEDTNKWDDGSWVVLTGYSKTVISDKEIFDVTASYGDNAGYHGHYLLEYKDGENPFNLFNSCYEIIVNPEIKFITKGKNSWTKLFDFKKVKKVNRDATSLNQGLKHMFTGGAYNVGIVPLKNATPVNWQNNDGRNYLTYTKNQHIPVYCGSCWAQAGVSVISDRLNIQRIKEGKLFPKLTFSVQAIINCKQAGSCFGGDTSLLFQKMKTWKLPVESCSTYQSRNPKEYICDAQSICSLNMGDKYLVYDTFPNALVKSWKRVRGADNIKAELLNGPLACSFEVTQEFVKYKRIDGDKLNIWTTTHDYIDPNHEIEVVGWGIQDGVEYWVARNSWGKEWGYDGFFYMEAGKNILGIEADCASAEVVYNPFA